jgi:hypothetical protein
MKLLPESVTVLPAYATAGSAEVATGVGSTIKKMFVFSTE